MADWDTTRRSNRFKDITDQTFTRLTARNLHGKRGSQMLWDCDCSCGGKAVVTTSHLLNGHTQSCGCLQRERTGISHTKHGMRHTRIWNAWSNMKNRCENPKNWNYYKYGARGIKVCERWQSFENFYTDMGDPPSPKHSLDRYPEQNGNYEPGNVRWATAKMQTNNLRSNRLLTYNGETHTMQGWCDKLGIGQGTLSTRLNRLKWSVERALSEPVR